MKYSEQLPAIIIISFIISTFLTIIITIILLRLYRQRVLRSMNKESKTKWASNKSFKPTDRVSFSVSNNSKPDINVKSDPDKSDKWNFRQTNDSLNKATLPYIIGGIFYSIMLSIAVMYAADKGNLNFSWSRFLLFFICYYWPVVYTIKLINSLVLKKYILSYLIIYLVIIIIYFSDNIDSSYTDCLLIFLINAPPTFFLLVLLNRKIRAISPLVFVFMFIIITGSYSIIISFGNNDKLIEDAAKIGDLYGLSAIAILLFILIIGIVVFIPIGWLFLHWIGKRYRKKKMSDLSLNIDILWIIFVFFHTFGLIFFEDPKYIMAPIIAIAIAIVGYKIIVWIVRLLIKKNRTSSPDRKILLLLRVFSLGQKSEQLFDLISRFWLRKGSIYLISGPDLAKSTIEPHEFYDFIGGELSRLFIHNETDLNNKIANTDLSPDPDGRYRVNEFFCMTNTWQLTMQRLAGESNAVLMDLRSFSNINSGCVMELEYLLNYVHYEQIILLIDKTTNRPFLDKTITSILNSPNELSPNTNLNMEELNIFTFKQNNQQEMQDLLELLFK